MSITLRDGSLTEDPRLDRLPEFDEHSRGWPIRALLTPAQAEVPPRSWSWAPSVSLDQGNEGACVGFSWAHELSSRPYALANVTAGDATWVYHRAQDLDEWEGTEYSGTSVLAGAKAVQERGGLTEYRWAFGYDDLVRAIAYKGPAILGLNWYTGMMAPDSEGRIRPTGQIEGGHAIEAPRYRGTRWAGPKRYVDTLWVYNSWGPDWGPLGPWAWLTRDDASRLLAEQGEACIPVIRGRWT